MGSYNWVRNNKKGSSGKTFAVGVAAVVPQQQQKKRKLVWQRGDETATAEASNADAQANPEIPQVAETTTDKQQKATETKKPSVQKKEIEEKQAALEALQRKIAEQKKALEESAAAAKRARTDTLQKKLDEEREREQRKQKLDAAFSKVFAEARQAAASDIAARRAPITFADEAEVKRVLAAHSDYNVLKLEPGADGAMVRKRYREMAVTLHPDKCSAPGAADAFNRLVTAYQQLQKYTK